MRDDGGDSGLVGACGMQHHRIPSVSFFFKKKQLDLALLLPSTPPMTPLPNNKNTPFEHLAAVKVLKRVWCGLLLPSCRYIQEHVPLICAGFCH